MGKDQKSEPQSVISSFIGGTLAGWARVFVGQPFDIVKVRLVVQSSGSSSALGVLSGIVKQEGVKTLWRGSLAPSIGTGICTSIMFGSYAKFKQLFTSDPNERLANWKYIVAGTGAALCQVVAASPSEGLRIRRQVQGTINSRGDVAYMGDLDCIKSIMKEFGIRGWYKGTVATALRDCVGYSSYFLFLENATHYVKSEGRSNLSPLTHFICGGLAGILYWTMCYPFDVVKTKIQGDSLHRPRYKGIVDCAKHVYHAHGARGFYKGYLPCFLRAFPVNAAMSLVYEMYGRLTK